MSNKPSTLQEIGLQVKALNDQVCAIFDEVDAKQGGEITAEQKERVKTLNKEIEELEKKGADTQEFEESRKAALARKDSTKAHHAMNQELDNAAKQGKLSDFVLGDEGFKAFMEKGYGHSGAQFNHSPIVQLKTLITGASSTSGGALIVNDRKPIVDPGVSYRELTIFDIITLGETGVDAVEFVREGTHTNAAAVVAEATATGNGTGASPESAMALSVVTANVKNISHFLPASRFALSDAGQMSTLIDKFLMYGVMEELEDQVVAGSGTGNDFTGILNISGGTAQAWDTDLFTTTRKGRTKVKTTGRAKANAYVLNPSDWETLDLATDNENRYYYGGPSAMGNPRLWGLPVVECEAMTAGTGMVADFRLAVLWERQQVQISVSDSHSDFFIRRMIAILGEMRAAFDVLRPAAFVEMDLTA